eukprot:m.70253 g.70253  ORF g.70253 m.70253 type:complete len:111 (+) comp8303_c2_seq1:901-1233(+)
MDIVSPLLIGSSLGCVGAGGVVLVRIVPVEIDDGGGASDLAALLRYDVAVPNTIDRIDQLMLPIPPLWKLPFSYPFASLLPPSFSSNTKLRNSNPPPNQVKYPLSVLFLC